MKIVIEDFNYKGHHIDRCEYEFPQLNDVDEVLSDRMLMYMSDGLDEFIKAEGD